MVMKKTLNKIIVIYIISLSLKTKPPDGGFVLCKTVEEKVSKSQRMWYNRSRERR